MINILWSPSPSNKSESLGIGIFASEIVDLGTGLNKLKGKHPSHQLDVWYAGQNLVDGSEEFRQNWKVRGENASNVPITNLTDFKEISGKF